MIDTHWRYLIFSRYIVYGLCWIFPGCPSNLKRDLHTSDALLWFPQHSLSKSTRDGPMAVASLAHRVQDVAAKTLKSGHINEFHCYYLASTFKSNTCQAVDFWWGLMSVFEQHLKKQNYKWHIWESALKPRNCRKISGTAWPKANHAFKTLIIWHSVNDAARPALPFRRWWIWHTSEGQRGNERLPTNSHSSKTWGKLK